MTDGEETIHWWRQSWNRAHVFCGFHLRGKCVTGDKRRVTCKRCRKRIASKAAGRRSE
jgi:hypothetical protein